MTANTMIVCDAAQIAGNVGTVLFSASRQAALQFDTAPDSPVSGSTPVVSLWQKGMLGLMASRYFSADKMGANGVALVTGASYSGDSP